MEYIAQWYGAPGFNLQYKKNFLKIKANPLFSKKDWTLIFVVSHQICTHTLCTSSGPLWFLSVPHTPSPFFIQLFFSYCRSLAFI